MDEHALMSTPGWLSGRLLDGYMTKADGFPAEFEPPGWLRELRGRGYDQGRDGEPLFVVSLIGARDLAGFATPREALRDGLERIRAEPEQYQTSLAVIARAPTGQTATIVAGVAVEGFAMGALEAEPIRLITGPAFFDDDVIDEAP